MAFDGFTTFPAETPPPNPLAFVTTCAALAAYDLARLTHDPRHYRDAADQLASALKRERAMRVSAKVAESPAPAASPIRARRTAAPKAFADDLAAPLGNVPRAKACAGAYVVRWADGSETHVSGVVHHRDKPATRWAAAFQAADRLRRLRMRHAYAEALDMGAGLLHGRWEIVSSVRRERADWWRLVQIAPMAALASIEEDGGESFTPAEGAAFGAGDAEAAAMLEAALTSPRHPLIEVRHPGELAEARANAAETFGALDSEAEIVSRRSLDDMWEVRRAMRRDHPHRTQAQPARNPILERETFGALDSAAEPTTAHEGEGLAGAEPRDLDGAEVVISPRQAAAIRAFHKAATEELPEDSDETTAAYGRRDYAARAQIDRDRLGVDGWARLDFWRARAEQLAQHAFTTAGLVRFRVTTGPGGFWLNLRSADGRLVTLDTRRGETALLALAA